MPFNQKDFENAELRSKLVVITNDRLKYPLLQKFSELTLRQQKEFNIETNKYIFSLPDELYLEQIDKDFNEIAFDYLTNPKFKAEEQKVTKIQKAIIELEKVDNLDEKLFDFEQKSILKVN